MEITDQIRQAANIIDIASQYTTLRRRGKKHVGLCPFHSEKSPSFTLDEEKQLFHCFGCGAGGDVFTLVMEKENLSFPEAMRYLAEKYNLKLPERIKSSPQALKLKENLFKISENALAFFKKNLFNTKEGEKALDYLKKRNISDEVIQNLKIGYALDSWDFLLSFFQRKGIDPGVLEKSGLVLRRQKKEGYYDRFRGRIIFPIFTETGKVVAFGGRSLFNEEPKYLNSPDTEIYSKGELLYGLNFCKEAIRDKGEIILVEGYTDFISLYQAGITNVSASLGTSLTPRQVSLAKRFAPRMIVSYDADAAGAKAATRAVSLCFENGTQIRILLIPEGLDPDSFINKFGADRFKNLIRKSISGLKFLIDTELQERRTEVPEEKARIARNIVNEIEKMPDPVVRSEYLKQTSEYLSIDEGVLRLMPKSKSTEKKDEEKDIFLPAEKILLQMLFEDSLVASEVLKKIEDKDFKGLKSEPIFKTLSEYVENGKTPKLHEFREKIDRFLFSSLSKILQEKGEPPSMEKAHDCLDTLKMLALENRWKELNIQIARLERKGEKEKLPTLLSQRFEITKQLSVLLQRNY